MYGLNSKAIEELRSEIKSTLHNYKGQLDDHYQKLSSSELAMFEIGDRVEKIADTTIGGRVIGRFLKSTSGETRYIVEYDSPIVQGVIRIFKASDIRRKLSS